MKIVFLDIDGVLNSKDDLLNAYEVWKTNNIRSLPINEGRIKLLKQIIDETDAKIVLSSSWRFNFDEETLLPINDVGIDLLSLFNKHGIKMYSLTPRSETGRREEEIEKWLELHPDVTSFVILDDEISDLTKYKENIVHTAKAQADKSIYENSGIKEENVKEAILILKR